MPMRTQNVVSPTKIGKQKTRAAKNSAAPGNFRSIGEVAKRIVSSVPQTPRRRAIRFAESVMSIDGPYAAAELIDGVLNIFEEPEV